MCFDIKNFYLGTPLNRPKYVRIHLNYIPQKFITEYNLTAHARDCWVYFRTCKGVYVLPQAGKLANNLLCKRLDTKGRYEAATNPGLWIHKWCPVIFCLTVDDFGIEYVGKNTRNISSPHFRDTTHSLPTGRGRNIQTLILSGTTNPVPSDSPWMTTSGNSFSYMAIHRHANHSIRPTSIVILYTTQSSISQCRSTPLLD